MADKHKGQEPGEDVALAFDMDFGDDDKGAGGFGAPEPQERAPRRAAAAAPPPPPNDFGDDDFEEMPEPGSGFGAPVQPPRDEFGDVGHGVHAESEFGQARGFGDEDPVENFDAPADDHEHDRAFADAGGGEDMEFEGEHHEEAAETEEDADAVLRHDGEDEEDDEPSVAPEAAGRGLARRMMVPAIGLLTAGGIGYFGWAYAVQPMFFADAPVQTAQPGIRTTPQVGMPKNGQMPPPPYQTAQREAGTPGLAPMAQQRQPQAAPPQAQPIQPQPFQAPAGPQVATADPSAPLGAVAPPPAAPVGNPLAAMPSVPTAPPGQVPTGMNRPDADVMAKMFAAIDAVSTDVKSMSRRVDGIERNGNDMRADLGRRMDEIDSRAKGGVQVATAVPGALPPVVVRAPALGKPSVPTAAPAAPAAPKAVRTAARPSDEDSEERAERPAKKSRHAVRAARGRDDAESEGEDRAYAGDGAADEPPSKPRVIGSYRLQGVSQVGGRSVALLRTKRGLEEVGVGQTLPGGGEVRSIRENGGRWVVVTSRGVIVE
jgi:hypothetical protein